MATKRDQIKSRNGKLTAYGFSLGYVEQVEGDQVDATLSREHGAYLVKGFKGPDKKTHFCDAFPTLSSARIEVRKLKNAKSPEYIVVPGPKCLNENCRKEFKPSDVVIACIDKATGKPAGWTCNKVCYLQWRTKDLPIIPEVKTGTNTPFDNKMFVKGYRYKLTPTTQRFEPLYAKTMDNVSSIMKDYKDETFAVTTI